MHCMWHCRENLALRTELLRISKGGGVSGPMTAVSATPVRLSYSSTLTAELFVTKCTGVHCMCHSCVCAYTKCMSRHSLCTVFWSPSLVHVVMYHGMYSYLEHFCPTEPCMCSQCWYNLEVCISPSTAHRVPIPSWSSVPPWYDPCPLSVCSAGHGGSPIWSTIQLHLLPHQPQWRKWMQGLDQVSHIHRMPAVDGR